MEDTIAQLFQQMLTLVRSAPSQESLIEEIKTLQWKILCLWKMEAPPSFPFSGLYQMLPTELVDLNETITL
jgi:hypothetical protein